MGNPPGPATIVVVGWSTEQMTEWFLAAHQSDEGQTRCRNAAAKWGLRGMAGDLSSEWFLSVLSTLQRRGVPDWISSEDDAWRYVLRALSNRSVDLARSLGRAELPGSSVGDEATDLLANLEDEGPSADPAADWGSCCDQMAGHIGDLLADGQPQCPGCGSPLPAQVLLSVSELIRAGEDATTTPEIAELQGGVTEWDRLFYEALHRAAPQRVVFDSPGRLSAKTRQVKSRCSGCIRPMVTSIVQQFFPPELTGGLS